MHFLEWFEHHARWSTIGWLSIVGLGAYWEITGVLRKDGTTFTDLVRSTVPLWARAAVLGMLAYHLLIDPANFK